MFDPYHKWLGIPADQRPPTYYQLLGISQTEKDREVIREAGIRQTAHLRTYQTGAHAADCTRLLNEVAQAQTVLLDPAKRKEYDAKLAARKATTTRPKTAAPQRRPIIKASSKQVTRGSSGRVGLLLGAVIILIAGGAGGFVIYKDRLRTPPPGDVADAAKDAPRKDDSPLERPINNDNGTSVKPPPLWPDSRPELVPPPSIFVVKYDPRKDPRLYVKFNPESKLPEVIPPPSLVVAKYDPSKDPRLVVMSLPKPPPSRPDPGPRTMPVPDAAAQKKAETEIRDFYKTEYARKAPADLLRLSGALVEQARASKEPVERFVLLREAADLAARTADAARACEALDLMAKEYDVNLLEMKTQALEVVERSLDPVARHYGQEYYRIMTENVARLGDANNAAIDAAVAADRYDLADRLLKVAGSAAEKSRNKTMFGAVAARRKEVDQLRKEYEKIQESAATLARNPADPEACVVMGRYLCLQKGDWPKGLPLLAASNERPLKELAVKDLAGSRDPAGQIALGDGWSDLAESERGSGRTQLLRRAYHWYQQAAPAASGFAKSKVERRMAEIEKTGAVVPVVTSRFLPLALTRFANQSCTRSLWSTDSVVDRSQTLPFPKWGQQEWLGVPYVIEDPQGGKVNNVIRFVGRGGGDPGLKEVRLPCSFPVGKVHVLTVAGYGFLGGAATPALTVRLVFEDGTKQEEQLVSGIHLADRHFAQPLEGSRSVIQLEGNHVRYAVLRFKPAAARVQAIEFIRLPDNITPVLVAVTVERPEKE